MPLTDEKLLKSEYVISYPNWGDRGRMRGSSVAPTGTLHRPTCRAFANHESAYAPADVYATTLDDFKSKANAHGYAGKQRVCQRCCSDLPKIEGRRMEHPPEDVEVVLSAEEIKYAVVEYVERHRGLKVRGEVTLAAVVFDRPIATMKARKK